ncbi:hypothetical protein MMC25_006016 [Agyrium rufum]|nr:hypothetical protein [Agyrium rufum]
MKEFPDISSKLTAPSKKSLFEKQKAETEAKRAREQQETAAVYEDFVKSFDDAGNEDEFRSRRGFGESSGAAPGLGGPPRRQFGGPPTGPSGRGSFGAGRGPSGPGSLGPPPTSLSRKRVYDGTPSGKDVSQSLFSFEDSNEEPIPAKKAFEASDDEEEKSIRSKAEERAAPRPTLHLSSLPPGTSQAVIKSIFPTSLRIDAVKVLPPSGTERTDRRAASAIVTLSKETPAVDIDTIVSSLQNRYLGKGFYLSLSRHLSSAAIGSTFLLTGSSLSVSLPFGAKAISTNVGHGFSRAPPPGPHRGGFAPPSSYVSHDRGPYGRGNASIQVSVTPPSDLKQLKLIHRTIESVLTHGPEFEALLMNRYEVQIEEKWAWLWDPRSVGGVWYRWRLWDVLTGGSKSSANRTAGSTQSLFNNEAQWVTQQRVLPHEYVTELEEFVSDSDYDSSEDESGDEGRRRYQHLQGGKPIAENILGSFDAESQSYLNPLQKAKLVHLLARLPTTNAKLRRGDIARTTAFAIQHAGEGAQEVVDIITSNVRDPFTFSNANPDHMPETAGDKDDHVDEEKKTNEREEISSSKLIALYVISDILSSSSTSGVRHAWRYRQLFETVLKKTKVFEHLGRLEKEMQWGRLRAEKWKRSVNNVLSLWEGWCVFPQEAQDFFTSVFADPPLTEAEQESRRAAEKEAMQVSMSRSKWKTVEKNASEKAVAAALSSVHATSEGDVDMLDEGDVDGQPLDSDEDVDGQLMMEDDDDVDGAPMEDEDGESLDADSSIYAKGVATTDEHQPISLPEPDPATLGELYNRLNNASSISKLQRRRPKAEDMFADSDGE